jgi:hypothetical protein
MRERLSSLYEEITPLTSKIGRLAGALERSGSVTVPSPEGFALSECNRWKSFIALTTLAHSSRGGKVKRGYSLG